MQTKPEQQQTLSDAATIEWANISEMDSQRWKASDKIFLQTFYKIVLQLKLYDKTRRMADGGPDFNYY